MYDHKDHVNPPIVYTLINRLTLSLCSGCPVSHAALNASAMGVGDSRNVLKVSRKSWWNLSSTVSSKRFSSSFSGVAWRGRGRGSRGQIVARETESHLYYEVSLPLCIHCSPFQHSNHLPLLYHPPHVLLSLRQNVTVISNWHIAHLCRWEERRDQRVGGGETVSL